jgi:hypothetical protein
MIGAQPIRMQAAKARGVSRRDVTCPVLKTGRYEEATLDLRHRPRGVAPRALQRDFRDGGEVMFPMALALPLALLPIVSLMATLRWMAVSSG